MQTTPALLAVAVASAISLAPAQSTPPPAGTTQDPTPSSKPKPRAQAPDRLPEVIVREAEVRDGDVLDAVPLEHAGGRTVLGPQIVRDSGAVSVQELLRRSPGVVIQDETGSDSLPNIAMRGVTNGAEGAWRSINLGMYADGIPLAPAPYGAPGNSLFPFALERVYAVDVQRGGGAVRYGPNNVSGVVNFLTRPIPEQATVFGKVRADSFDNYAYYTAMGGTTGPFGALLEVVYKNGETWREGGDYELENYALKTSYELSDRLRLLAQFEKFDDDTNLADGLSLAAYQADPKQTQAPLNRFSGSQERANVKLEWDIDSDTRFELISYWYDGNRTFHLGSPIQYGSTPPAYIQTTPRPMRTVALQPQLTRSYLLGDVESELHVGLRYLQEDLVRTVSRYFADGSTQLRRSESQFDYYTASAWLENTLRWGDWTVTPGLRFEYVRIDARDRLNGNSAGQEFTEVLPGLTVNRRLTQQVAVFAAVQSTFAAPQAAQIDLANHPQDVSAQHAWNYEVGGRGSFFDALFDVDLTLYQIEYRDRLVRDPNQFDVFVNGGNSRHRGVELALRSDLGRVGLTGVSLWGSAAYNDSRFTDGAFDGNRFAGAPAWIASWGARYQHAATGLFCSVDGSYVDAIYTDALNTVVINAAGTNGVRPSYRLWNASAGWRHDVSEQTQLGVLVGGRNVFDEQYGEPRTGRGIFPGAPASIFFEFDFTHRF